MSALADVVRRRFGGLFSKPARDVAGTVLAAVVLLSSVLVLRSEARSEVLPDLSDGAAWLRSTGVGYLSLVDGASGEVLGSFSVAKAADDFEIQPRGSDAIVVNHSGRAIARMLARTWEITPEHGFGENVLDVQVGEQRSWMVRPGFVSTLDLDEFKVGKPLAVGAAYDNGHVSRNGALFYGASEADEAPLIVTMVDGETRSRSVDGLSGPVEFAELEDTTVVVDHDGLVWTESGGIVCDNLEITDNGVVAAGGFDRLLVATADGVAFFWDPRAQGCPPEPVDLGASSYGDPVVGDGWAVVPDLTAGQLVVILSDGGIKRHSPAWLPDDAKIELIAENDNIWFNDPNSAAAGVVRRDGTLTETIKYKDGGEGVITPRVAEDEDDTPGQSNQVQADDGGANQALAEGDQGFDDNGDEPSPETGSSATTNATASTNDPTITDPTTPSLPDNGAAAPPDSPPTVDGPAGPTTSPSTPREETAIRVQIAQTDLTPIVGARVRYQAQTMEGAPVRWEWSVTPDDGTKSASGNDFWYTYGTAGSYTVRVTACDAQHRCDEASLTVRVVPDNASVDLIAAFTGKTSAQAAESVSFESTSQGDPDGLEWTFEGGSPGTATGSRVNATWLRPDVYRVTLRVTRGQESHSAQRTITITAPQDPPPFEVSCSPTTIGQGSSTNCSLQGTASDFTNLALRPSPDAPISNAGSGQFVVTPGSAGSYTMTLTGNNASDGAPRSATATITVQSTPPPEEIVASVTGPTTLAANVAGTYALQVDSGEVGSITWFCGSSTSSGTGASVACTWSTAGTYTVRAETTVGGSFTRTVSVTAPTAPAPSIRIDGPTTVVVGQALNLTGTVLAGSPTSWSWNTNGGTPGTAATQNVSVSWGVAGTYTVSLTATAAGVSGSDTHTVTVNAPAKVYTVTEVGLHLEDDDFTLTIQTSECTVVVWSIPAAGFGPYPASPCLSTHRMSPRTGDLLAPSTTYQVVAAFMFADGHVENRTFSITTTAGATPADPVVSTSVTPSGAIVTVTMTSDVCTTIPNAWFSSTDDASREHTEGFADPESCQRSRSYTFIRQTDDLGNFRPYRVNVTYSLPDRSWSDTTVNNLSPG